MCKSVNLEICRFFFFFFFWKVLFERVQRNRHRNGLLMGQGVAGWETPSGLFCIFLPFELQIGGRRKHFGIRAAADFTGQRPKQGQQTARRRSTWWTGVTTKTKLTACDCCWSFSTTSIYSPPWCLRVNNTGGSKSLSFTRGPRRWLA